MEVPISGYHEIEHTADTALHVWAPDLSLLFIEAAKGTNYLAGVTIDEGGEYIRLLMLEASDLESLLVKYLEEILFLGEHDGLGFDQFEVDISEDYLLRSKVQGARIGQKRKEIKAVTFHNMNVKKTDKVYEVTIVFDV